MLEPKDSDETAKEPTTATFEPKECKLADEPTKAMLEP